LAIANGKPGVLMRLMTDHLFAKEELAFLKEMIRVMQERAVHSLLALATMLSSDDARRARALEYIMRGLRKELLGRSAPPAGARLVEKIKRIDRITALMETTNVNTRLALDAIMMEVAA
jgi:hypothetical protein